MTYFFEPPSHVEWTSQEHIQTPVDIGGSLAGNSTPLNDLAETNSLPFRRTDVLRHVFPRPRTSSTTRRSSTHVAKSQDRKSPPSSSRISKRRVALHRVFTSFFHNTPATVVPRRPVNLPVGSSAPSTRSRAGSGSNNDSMPSIELVSPGTFMFSGPSLRSYSRSFSNSTSRLTILTENGSD
jgi:hypothetical protein